MLGTGMMPHQNSKGNIGKQRIPMNGLNLDAKSGLPGSELRTGAEIPLELAGQKPEVVAQQVEQIVEKEIKSFKETELKRLADITTEATQKIDPQNEDVARIVGSIATPFAKAADRLYMKISAEIQQVLSDNPGSTQDSNKPPLSFLSPNTPSKQDPQGPVSAA